MIIKFLRSSASTPVINLKMCQEDSFESYECPSTLNEGNNNSIENFEEIKYGVSKHVFRVYGSLKKNKKDKKNAYNKSRASKGPNASYNKIMSPHVGFINDGVDFVQHLLRPVERTWRSFYALLQMSSCLTYLWRFASAGVLELCPFWILSRFITQDIYDILRSRFYFERIIVSRFMNTELFNGVYINAMQTYNMVYPNYEMLMFGLAILFQFVKAEAFCSSQP